MKHKVFAIVISFALVLTMVLPGTLALANDQDRSTEEAVPTAEGVVTEDVSAGDVDPAPVVDPVECSCGTETDVHSENCPLYVAPDPEPVKECTCGTEDGTHSEDCPLYVAPELTLAERLLATETVEEFEAIIAEATEEELIFTCEEFDKVDAHYIYLTTGDYPNYEPVVDTVLEIVNFTNVAPFVGTGK